jgi:hypothetical protein
MRDMEYRMYASQRGAESSLAYMRAVTGLWDNLSDMVKRKKRIDHNEIYAVDKGAPAS